ILTLNGYEVVAASNGPDALQLCELSGGQFELLISDVVMSPMTGVELVQKVAARWPAISILLISGFPGPVELPMDEHGPRFPLLSKPFTNFAQLARVRELLSSRPT